MIKAYLNAANVTAELAPKLRYVFWTFNGHTPAPFIRTRRGDTLQMEFSSTDDRGMSHNVDFHAVMGAGRCNAATQRVEGNGKERHV